MSCYKLLSKCVIRLEDEVTSAQKLRADPDDQPPIEERSIMMPTDTRSLRLFSIHQLDSENILLRKKIC